MRLTPHHVGLVVSDLTRATAFYEALVFLTDPDLAELEIMQEA